jgi:hypothetical protein
MFRRLHHPTLSTPFYNSLKKLDYSRLPEPPVTIYESAQEEERDRTLLSILLTAFHSDLPPNLLQQAEAAVAGHHFQAYSAKTHVEFHKLLCDSIQIFRDLLKELNDYDNAKRSKPFKLDVYRGCLYTAVLRGETLFQIVQSTAIVKHLQLIEPLLVDLRRDKGSDRNLPEIFDDSNDDSNDDDNDDKDDDKDDKDDDKDDDIDDDIDDDKDDDELRSIQPEAVYEGRALVPLWKAYHHWLLLMVAYCDSALTLRNFINETQVSKIVIKILVPPKATTTLLPWEELLQSRHFPEDSKNDISTFLKEFSKSSKMPFGAGMCRILEDVKRLPVVVSDFDASIEKIIKDIDGWQKSEAPGWKPYVQATVSKIALLKKVDRQSEWIHQVDEIIKRLETLHHFSLFFRKLTQAPLATGVGICASRHCELELMSLVSLARTLTSGPKYEELKHVLDELRVSVVVNPTLPKSH